jgi:pimeloyl-ACP methyl ester carboxylesterase
MTPTTSRESGTERRWLLLAIPLALLAVLLVGGVSRVVHSPKNDGAVALAEGSPKAVAAPRAEHNGGGGARGSQGQQPAATGPRVVYHHRPEVHVLSFGYRAWNGAYGYALVVVPAWYRKAGRPPLPLVISSHGRGGGPLAPLRRWRHLEARDGFILVAPSGQGRRFAAYSFAAPGQVSDLMRMPQLVRRAFPWIRIRRRCIYAAGSSMAGMEALMLAALYPDRIAACVSADPVTDLAARYRVMPVSLATGPAVQDMVRLEVGGTPEQVPLAYAVRSPLAYARNLAYGGVPLLVYWSPKDRVVVKQGQQQAGRLCRRIRSLNPNAPLTEIVTGLPHGLAYSYKERLPQALDFLHPGGHWRTLPASPPPRRYYASAQRSATIWGYRIIVHGTPRAFWHVSVATNLLRVVSAQPLSLVIPASAGTRVLVRMAGRDRLLAPARGHHIVVRVPPGGATVRLSP